MIGMIRASISILLLILLSGCFGGTLFQLGPIPVKSGDIITKPFTKSILDKEQKKWYIIYYGNKNTYTNRS